MSACKQCHNCQFYTYLIQYTGKYRGVMRLGCEKKQPTPVQGRKCDDYMHYRGWGV